MKANKWPALKIGELVSRLPIVQGGMSVGISLSGLAGAVAAEGGIGVIGTAGIGIFEPDFHKNFIEANIRALRKEIRKAREIAGKVGIIGVNIMTALTNFADMVKTSIEEGIDIIFSGAGLPMNLPSFLKNNARTKLVPIVSSARAAALLCRRWISRYNYLPDAIVVEGPKAGGHLGFKREQIHDPRYKLESLIPEVLTAIKPFEEEFGRKIPVIAAGGIYTGKDIYRFLQLGASGVQMATRFVATHECDASEAFKQAFLKAKKEDLMLIDSPVGLPGRAIRNKFLNEVEQGKRKPFHCPYHCIRTCDYKKSPYCIAIALTNAQQGKLKGGFCFAGSNVYRVDKIVSVKTLLEELEREYSQEVGSGMS